jgi:uncharacterized membrane protein (UPF0127 family)
MASNELKVRVADTPHAVERGLMFVDDLPDNEGMLFVFPSSRRLNFWGKNTFIPLDIAFVDDTLRIVKIAKINPMDLIGVDSGKSCKYAIEANENYFLKSRITPGFTVEIIDGETPNEAILKFSSDNNNEGTDADRGKDNGKLAENTRRGQVEPPVNPLQPPKVDKPGESPVGTPIGAQPQMSQLPVLTKSDIGNILEDSFDEEQQEPSGETTEAPPPAPSGQEEEPLPEEYPTFATAFEAVQWAEDNNEVVHISYTTKRGRQLERDVEPHGQFHSDSTSRQILVTFDESVGDIRAFIIRNIGSWTFVGRKFAKKFVVKG